MVAKNQDGFGEPKGSRTPKKHPDNALSAVAVRQLMTPGRYADGNGLYLVVEPSGAKRWMLRTTIHGVRRDMGLGGARLVSLAEARDEARRLRTIARKGGDPRAERRRERIVIPAFEAAARDVHKEHSKSFRNAKHAEQWIDTLETYAFAVMGSRCVDQITSGDVLTVLSPIWLEIPETASRIRQRIKTVFDWAKAKGYRTGDNPTEGLTKVLPRQNRKPKHHGALPHAQVARFVDELRQQPSIPARLAFEFLILTAGRTSEVLLAKWNEIDMENRTWTVPAERMKAKVEHKVPLSARCLQILAAARELNGAPYIFPGLREDRPFSNMVLIATLRRMKRDGITPHGFRSTFRDWAEERTTFQTSVIEAALAHTVKNKVEAAYFRTTLFEKRKKLMDAWTAYMTAAAAKVVSIRA